MDRSTLLVLQRVSKKSWILATPILYRQITVKNWYTFLRLPVGLYLPKSAVRELGLNSSRQDRKVTFSRFTKAQLESIRRRFQAFRHTKQMTITSVPPIESMALFVGYNAVSDDETALIDLDIFGKKLFPNLQELAVTSSAFTPYVPGGRLYRQWSKRGLNTMNQPGVGLIIDTVNIAFLARPKILCLSLPLDDTKSLPFGHSQNATAIVDFHEKPINLACLVSSVPLGLMLQYPSTTSEKGLCISFAVHHCITSYTTNGNERKYS